MTARMIPVCSYRVIIRPLYPIKNNASFVTGGCRPGMYAIEVIGELPGEVLDFCEDKGIPYACKPPDGTR